MKVGITMFVTAYSIDIVTLAKRAEALGFESLWVPEHPLIPVESITPFPSGGPLPEFYKHTIDPFVGLAAAAGATEKLVLGTGICLVPERNPLMTAKEVATVDLVSGGRFQFGIGAGWLKEETDIMGGDFTHRWAQTREAILAMKQLWTTVESEYHGKYYDFPPVYSFPMPTQRPHPPILLGGMAKNVFKRVVDYGDGWMPNRVTPEDIKKGRAQLDELAEAAGRDPKSIQIAVFGQQADRDLLNALEEAGADSVAVRLETGNEEESLNNMEKMAEAVF